MGKIFEALAQAQRELMKEERHIAVSTPGDPGETTPQWDMHQEMALLYQHIDARLDGSRKKVIQFIAAREGEGTSTIVREFARTSATILGNSVFLFDADAPNDRPAAAVDGTEGDEDSMRIADQEPGEANVSRHESSTTTVCLIPQTAVGIRKHFYSPQIDSFWESLRQRFDMVLIDSPPFETSPDGIAISRRVDGVVLVLEAEKTRWPIAERLKEQIQMNGGNILGIVFNKRRYHIPEFVYRWL